MRMRVDVYGAYVIHMYFMYLYIKHMVQSKSQTYFHEDACVLIFQHKSYMVQSKREKYFQVLLLFLN